MKKGVEVADGVAPDDMQIGIEWVDLDKLNNYNLYPKVLKKVIREEIAFDNKVYLGDVN
ncbi:hypothetical protein [Halonatronum saccharophilum]|uniref:hypothetical protein n=1 Tax=Halonatronum saccharophilum TaxID=150060 RepID=UPI0004B01B38|nr:hypothetical protein [Halonatronum saccharophilum]